MKLNKQRGQDCKITRGKKISLLIIFFLKIFFWGSKIPGCPNSEKPWLPTFLTLPFVQLSSFTLYRYITFNLHLCMNDFQTVIFNYELTFKEPNSLKVISLWLSQYPLKYNKSKIEFICCLFFRSYFPKLTLLFSLVSLYNTGSKFLGSSN